MRKAERTRAHILARTAPLFNKKGFEGTTLSDLTRVTGLTKGALYGNFEDKHDIALRAFEYAMTRVKDMVRSKVEPASSYEGRLLALLDFYAAYVFDPPVAGGCPLLNAAVECDDQHPAIRRIVVKELLSTINFIEGLLEKGIKTGEFRKDTQSARLAYVIFCMIEGALMFARVERSRKPMDIAVEHCRQMINAIRK